MISLEIIEQSGPLWLIESGPQVIVESGPVES